MIKHDDLEWLYNQRDGKIESILTIESGLSRLGVSPEHYIDCVATIQNCEKAKRMVSEIPELEIRTQDLRQQETERIIRCTNLDKTIEEKKKEVGELLLENEELQKKYKKFRNSIQNALIGQMKPLDEVLQKERRSFTREKIQGFIKYISGASIETTKADIQRSSRIAQECYTVDDENIFSLRFCKEAGYFIDDWLDMEEKCSPSTGPLRALDL